MEGVLIIGIDASNIRAGGGVTHLVELLRAADPVVHGFSKIVVWSGAKTLSRIESRPWIQKSSLAILEGSLFHRAFWQRFQLSLAAREASCDLLFVPGGSYAGDFSPVVSMSQNMLPFEWGELKRFGFSWTTVKMLLLRWTQSRTFHRSQGVVFLTDYARDAVRSSGCEIRGLNTVIPLGVHDRFFCSPRRQRPFEEFSNSQPLKVLYVSIVDMYKHQWHVADAVANLRNNGLPVELELIGPANPSALKVLRKVLSRLDPSEKFIKYLGPVPHDELWAKYLGADLFVFASSCENLPNILLEGMASGLPIASSNRGPMPEVLADSGLYFDPEAPSDIEKAIFRLASSKEQREMAAACAHRRARQYSWGRCADETFKFFAKVVAHHRQY